MFLSYSPVIEMLMDRQAKNGQTSKQNYINFESNLAMLVMYLLSSLNLIGQSVFQLESGNENVYGQTNRQMNRCNYTNFESNLAMMVIYLLVKFKFNWTKHFPVTVPKPNLNGYMSL